MANIAAIASGNFSSAATWTGGVIPGSGDVAYSNTFTVTISDTRTVQAITNAAGTGITVGGTFSLLNGANLTCTNANGVVQGATATSCITTPSLGVGSSASVAASVTTGQNQWTVIMSTAGTLNWVGNLSASGGFGTIQFTGSGIINYTGNIAAGSAIGIVPAGAGTLNVTGNVTGGSVVVGIRIDGASTVNVNGTVTGGSSTFAGIVNSSNGTLTVNGTCQSSTTAPAIAAGSATQITRLSGPFLLGASGNINPVQAASWRWAPTQIPTYYEVAASNGTTKRSLFTSDNMPVGGYPVPANVRSGTIYGPSSENTGTLAVPSPSAVSLGVATDNTVGTAILTAADVRTSVGLASANLDTQFSNIPANVWNALTSALTTAGSIGKLLVDNINATIGSRLPTGSYTAPLDAAGTASAVWSAATRTLSDASGVASAVWSAVSRTITGGTVDNLTNAPNVPSEVTIATAVRSELATELSRIDASITSRLSPSQTLARVTLVDTVTTLTNSPNVPSAATIAAAVWAAADKTGYSLTPVERQAIATIVEQSILNETDGQQVLNAIVGAIGNTNIDQVALIAAIRADIERSGGMLSSKSTLTAAQVWSNTTRTITGGTVDTLVNAPTVPSAAVIATAVWAAADKTGYSLTSTERQAIATAVEQSILNEGDGQAILNAIIGAIGNTNVDQVTLIAAIRADLERNGGMLAARSTLTAAGVRTELKPELDRIANCSTIETTAVTIQDALSG